jgi:ferredoxin-type protein NapH
MEAGTTNSSSLFVTHRYWFLLLGILLFLPPLSFLFQFTQDSSFCGTWCPRMFIVWRKGMTWAGFTQGMLRAYMGVLLVLGVLLSTLFLGRYWCSHLCPIGGAMELGSRIVPRKLQINFSGIPASFFRYGYLSIFFLAPALGIGSLCCNYCNFAVIPRLFGAAFSQADMAYFLRTAGLVNLGLVLVLGIFARGGRAYCNLLCPVGALDAIVSRLGMKFGKRVAVDEGKCNGCGDCEGVCPTWAIDMGETATIDQLSCMPCRLCEEICPEEAIRYEKTTA